MVKSSSDIGPIKIVVAMAQNGVIGADMDMPWKLSSDLKRFKQITMGQPIIMGRKTFESIGRALPGRTNIVISRNAAWSHEGVISVASLTEAIEYAQNCDGADKGICIVGGGQIYAQAMQENNAIGLSELHVTHVEAAPQGDTVFPAIDDELWTPSHSESMEAGEKDNYPTCYIVYTRK